MQHNLALCLFFRNSAPYLKEWIEFHRKAGVEHFYLYNNDSEDDFLTVLEPYLNTGLVDLQSRSGYFQQDAAFDECLTRARGLYRWLGFIDDDEFLFCPDGTSLVQALEPYSAHAGVAINWMLYGTGGAVHKEPGLVIDRFQHRAPNIDGHHKCVVQPLFITRCVTCGHLFEAKEGHTIVDQSQSPVNAPINPRPVEGPIRLHHYLMKSVEEFLVRRLARDAQAGDTLKRALVDWIRDDRYWSLLEDPCASRFFRDEISSVEHQKPVNQVSFSQLSAPTRASRGASIRVSAQVTNTGTAIWSDQHYIQICDPHNHPLGFFNVRGIPPESSQEVNFDIGIPNDATIGEVEFRLRGLQQDVEYFGAEASVCLTIEAPLRA